MANLSADYGSGKSSQRGTKVGKENFNAFDKTVLGDRFTADQGMYDKFTDQAYGQATRLLDPKFNADRKAFDQRAINQGLGQGTEAYQTAFDNYSRSKNDAYNQAAFGAMDYGNARLDADRAMDETQRQYDSGFLEQGRQFDNSFLEQARQANEANATNRYGINMQADTASGIASMNNALQNKLNQRTLDEQGRQFDSTFGEGNRRFDTTFDLQELTALEGINQGYMDRDYRDRVYNDSSAQQKFNNGLTLQQFAPGTSYAPTNTQGGFDNQFAADLANTNTSNNMWQGAGQVANNVAQNVDWGQVFNTGQPKTQEPWESVDWSKWA